MWYNKPINLEIIAYKYMFEKLFNTQKNPEEAEGALILLLTQEFDMGVNGPAMFRAFRVAREENRSKNYGLTNNHLLNIVKKVAEDMISAIDEVQQGGREQIIANINAEAEQLCQDLSEDEQKS